MAAVTRLTEMRARVSVGLALAAVVCSCLLSGLPAVMADSSFDAGVRFYKKKDYKSSIACFTQSIRQNRNDANAIYYHALSATGLGDMKTASQDYAIIVSRFPNSSAGPYAIQALSRLDPSYCRQLMQANGGGSIARSAGISRTVLSDGQSMGGRMPSDFASLPETSTVVFESSGGDNPLILIPAWINGRPIKMCFDTGASCVAIGKNHLSQIGVPAPTGAATSASQGVGSSTPVPVWEMNAVVKVGQISRTLPMSVQENMLSEPLLGQSFFNAFTYEIDNSAHTIRFRKKGSGGHGGNFGSADTVPFTRDPQAPTHLIVTAEINGKPMQMFFDTGAQPIAFTMDQLKQLNIQIPEDAQQGINQGIGGQTVCKSFPVHSIKLGPIVKADITITAVQDAMMPHPLLGQAFFGDYKYTIDENNNRIIFRR